MFALRKLEFRTVTVATSIFLSNNINLNKVLTNYCYDISVNRKIVLNVSSFPSLGCRVGLAFTMETLQHMHIG